MNQIRLILTRLSQSSSTSCAFRNVSRTTTTTFHNNFCTTTTKRTNTSKNVSLYRKITPLGNPNDTVTPVLDDWLRQGNPVNGNYLRSVVKKLRHYHRFKHALEVSRWMNEKGLIEVTARDVAAHLDLIGKVHGVEEAEKYFNGIPEKLRNNRVYATLLSCFAYAKCVEKAEAFMQKMKELGFASYPLPYNVMLDLHCRTHNHDKLAAILLEMEANDIKTDSYTYSILLNAYGGDRDIDKLKSVLAKMESDPELKIDWMTYAVAANQCLGAQLEDKALELLQKAEKRVIVSKKNNEGYSFILNLYGALGKREEVLRIWDECKKCKANNKDYMSVLRALLKFNDVETAEKIFKEWEDSELLKDIWKFNDMETAEKIFKDWEDSELLKDIRIPNILISMYCENGLIQKAEALVEKWKSEKWDKPDAFTWSWMTFGYVKSNKMDKAVESMKSALLEPLPPVCWKSKRENLVACLKYMKDEDDSEQLNAVIDTLKNKHLIPDEVLEKLVEYLSGKCEIEDVLNAGDEEETANE